MGRRDANPSEGRSHNTVAAVVSHDVPDLARTQLFVECTRAVLRARSELELVRTLCGLLVRPGLYSEACIGLADETCGKRRSFYAGADKHCLADPGHFWVMPDRAAAFERALNRA